MGGSGEFFFACTFCWHIIRVDSVVDRQEGN